MNMNHINQLQKDFKDWGLLFSVSEFKENLIEKLKNDGFSQNNSRLVFIVCSDDINRLNERETIENALTEEFGGEFHLGTLAAYPIGGLTGITAASHHPPDNVLDMGREEGNLIIFVSPHIGLIIEDELKYGKVLRPGQIKYSSCCGAMIGFLEFLKKSKNFKDIKQLIKDENDPSKYIIFKELIESFNEKLSGILNLKENNQQIIALSKLNYELVVNRTILMFKDFLKNSHFEGSFAILGGITINTRDQDLFVYRHYSLNSVSLT